MSWRDGKRDGKGEGEREGMNLLRGGLIGTAPTIASQNTKERTGIIRFLWHSKQEQNNKKSSYQ